MRWRRALACAAVVGTLVLPATDGAGASGAVAGAPTASADPLSDAIYRLYRGFFLREPDVEGFRGWHCLVSKGRVTLAGAADSFVASDEFRDRYGQLIPEQFLDLAYRNLFGRPPDPAGRAYWLDQLRRGVTSGWVMVHLTESEEFAARTAGGTPPSIDPATAQATTCGPVLLAWIPYGLPAGFAADVATIPQLTARTTVHGDLVELVGTRDAAGVAVDAAPAGWAWPVDAIAVDPASYAQFQRSPGREVLAALDPGEAVLTRSSAELRRLGVGGTLTFRGGTLRVSGVVDDRSGGAAEVVVHRADAGRLGIDTERFLLLRDRDRPAVEAAIRARAPAGSHLSLRGSADTPHLRHGDRVAPQVHVKQGFGEFLFRDADPRDREVAIDPAWVSANIVTEQVPLLGRVRCHRLVVPRVRAALQEVAARGYGWTVDPPHFAGCQYARRVAPDQGLSRHAWGLALDINVTGDPRGDIRSQHPVLVEAMRRQGFDWGGDWEWPDPGHYEARPWRTSP